jgi:hypothetical protein
MHRIRLTVLPGLLSLLLFAGLSSAQPFDHEQCYKIKDPVKLKGTLDMDAPQFNVEPGCTVGKAKFFCAPAEKTFVSATDKATGLPIAPLPVYAPDVTYDRICYKLKCPEPVTPPDTLVTDQFGTRTLTKFKTKMICTPAVKGGGFCGNGVIDAGEACDAPSLGACPGTCESDCTCTCPTACCYVENPPTPAPSPPDVNCFEYSGTPAQTTAFLLACVGPGVTGFQIKTGIPGPCGAAPSPAFGLPCFAAPNLVIVPPDSTCP